MNHDGDCTDTGCNFCSTEDNLAEHVEMEESFGQIKVGKAGTYSYNGNLIEILPSEVDKWVSLPVKLVLSTIGASPKMLLHMLGKLGPDKLYTDTVYKALQVIKAKKKITFFFDAEEYEGVLACRFGSGKEVRHITKSSISLQELEEM